MSLNWLRSLNWLLATFVFFSAISIFYLYHQEDELVKEQPIEKKSHTLPKRSFAQSEEAYQSIGAPLFELKYSPASLQLPDLRKRLVFHGKNGRPDAEEINMLLHFDILGCKNPISIPPGEPLYIRYDGSAKTCPYTFSLNNEETVLWMEAMPIPKGASVCIRMVDEKGDIVTSPSEYAEFILQEREYNRFGMGNWQIGKWRVDGSLFARQKARWHGKDRFLEEHGGEDFLHTLGKERIDFGEGEAIYSVFVAEGDALSWKDDRWIVAEIGEQTRDKPLFIVKKIEDRLFHGELWDEEGKNKIGINLIRSIDTWVPKNIEKNFKFVAAKTRTQFAFVINKERMVLSPDDWLLQTAQGWRKLETLQEIDDYVGRRLSGVLFVFNGCSTEDGRQTLQGCIYNSSRTEQQNLEIVMARSTETKPRHYEDEYDDDDDDEFDFDDDDEFDFDDDDDEDDEGEIPDDFFDFHYPGD